MRRGELGRCGQGVPGELGRCGRGREAEAGGKHKVRAQKREQRHASVHDGFDAMKVMYRKMHRWRHLFLCCLLPRPKSYYLKVSHTYSVILQV